MKMKQKCMNCEKKLIEEEIKLDWHFGTIWFCGNSCATAWCVDQILKKLK